MRSSLKKKDFISLGIVAFLILTLVLSLDLVKKTQLYLTEALGSKANIVVDHAVDQGPIIPFWQNLSQGGEEKEPFKAIIPEISNLKPAYIRIDHIYDFYDVVYRENGLLKFDWSKLDSVVDDILKTGAKPFLALSYMPQVISSGGITDQPQNWKEWQLVVQKTIEHFSGQQGRGLENVYYEVWNEPDLFGQWKMDGRKDYRLLYTYAAKGAALAQNTLPFKIGGPGTTAPYQIWVDDFWGYLRANSVRIDFYSWHRYSEDPQKFLDDANHVDNWLFSRGASVLEKVITEWGSDSEISLHHDGSFDAAHLVATTRQLIQRVDRAFIFEIKDGPNPDGQKLWGRWGFLTNEIAGPVEKKPKYFALQLLNEMNGHRLSLSGEGTWVSGFSVKDGPKTKVILVNFDQEEHHMETVPLTINNLENGNYSFREEFLIGPGKISSEIATDGTLKKEILLTPNNVVLVTLEKI
ncbi:MAG: hypothetical protein Q8P89_04100 [bacterium]|nr:hypothetical protein [bacterium]